jgi:GNAT superfamily N-acetyltransferase
MAEISIRQITREDVEEIMPLMIQLGYELNIDELMRRFEILDSSPGHRLFAAEIYGRIAGFCHVFARPALEKPPEAVVQSLVVESADRNSGIGRALMGAVETWAREQGFASICVYSQVERTDAHAFYANLGYKRVATSRLLRKSFATVA